MAQPHPHPHAQQMQMQVPPTIDFPTSLIDLTIQDKVVSSTDKDAAVQNAISNLNAMVQLMITHPQFLVPPPPTQETYNKRLTQQITKAKDDGNTHFKAGRHGQAITCYNLAIKLAMTRPAWEATVAAREEIAAVLANRSAAYLALGNATEALIDAETLLTIKRFWSKGFFRKARALQALNKLQDAVDTLRFGLEFESSDELKAELKSMEAALDASLEQKTDSTKADSDT